MIDDFQEEAASLYALDLLDPVERAAFEVELARNTELRQLVEQLKVAAADVALTATPANPSPLLKARVLASIDASAKTRSLSPARGVISTAPAASSSSGGDTKADNVVPFRLPTWLGWAAAAGLAITAGYFGQQTLASRSELASLRTQAEFARVELQSVKNQAEAERIISQQQSRNLQVVQQEVTNLRTTLATERATAETRIAELQRQSSLAELKIASLASLAGNTAEAHAVAVWNPSTQEGVLTVEKLPVLARDQDYQLWVVDPAKPAPVNGGVFTVDPKGGQARIQFKPDQPVVQAAKFAISVERKGGVPKAEGPIVMLSQ